MSKGVNYKRKFDVSSPVRLGEDKAQYWLRCGTAFEQLDGRINIKMDSIPCAINDKGQIELVLFDSTDRKPGEKPDWKGEAEQRKKKGGMKSPVDHSGGGEDVPFAFLVSLIAFTSQLV